MKWYDLRWIVRSLWIAYNVVWYGKTGMKEVYQGILMELRDGKLQIGFIRDQDRILFGIKKDWIGNKFGNWKENWKENCKEKENKYAI